MYTGLIYQESVEEAVAYFLSDTLMYLQLSFIVLENLFINIRLNIADSDTLRLILVLLVLLRDLLILALYGKHCEY